jgi:hypothetical protein
MCGTASKGALQLGDLCITYILHGLSVLRLYNSGVICTWSVPFIPLLMNSLFMSLLVLLGCTLVVPVLTNKRLPYTFMIKGL